MEHIEHPKDNRRLLLQRMKEVNLHLGGGLEKALQIMSECKNDNIKPLFFIDGDHSHESAGKFFL